MNNFDRLNARIIAVITKIDPEYRMPVMVAARNSDGTWLSFQMELSSQAWDNPGLPVQDIIDSLSFDLA